MGRPYRLQEVEEQHGIPLDQLIPDTVNRLGSQKAAADELGVSQATLSVWLKLNGYTARTVYVQDQESEHATAAG